MSRLSMGGRGVAKIARERTEGTEVDSVVSYKLPDPETRLSPTIPSIRDFFSPIFRLLGRLSALSIY